MELDSGIDISILTLSCARRLRWFERTGRSVVLVSAPMILARRQCLEIRRAPQRTGRLIFKEFVRHAAELEDCESKSHSNAAEE